MLKRSEVRRISTRSEPFFRKVLVLPTYGLKSCRRTFASLWPGQLEASEISRRGKSSSGLCALRMPWSQGAEEKVALYFLKWEDLGRTRSGSGGMVSGRTEGRIPGSI